MPFSIKEYGFSEKYEVINWMVDNQLGKRNLTEQQKSYLRGKRYNNEKLYHSSLGDQIEHSGKTADKLASDTEEELKEVVHSLSFSVIQDRSRNQCFARKGRKLLDKVNEVLRQTEESPFQ